ncbi:MAG: hypothetical protein RR387_05170 [Clostridiales bacterium]
MPKWTPRSGEFGQNEINNLKFNARTGDKIISNYTINLWEKHEKRIV